ncbi:hypothetical protein PLESTB_001516400 [Pleodorina starrii]|uniref:Plastid lipid-associated protein/fibrillin conserved domain-containing protein n=1 Tax=Pleodorina starrii TaxID=330485 RepID=A0A9W6BWM8_9CHLO|nr:hypothetical protein PLESTM_001047300 [Pleodorina starrii]GLC59634.1 hypothetical protein PLESTB_001516400 [Pleodorina starrii]GLC74602.1 hypothetical protein PLESTF_001534000 [Pleodorina starrii]
MRTSTRVPAGAPTAPLLRPRRLPGRSAPPKATSGGPTGQAAPTPSTSPPKSPQTNNNQQRQQQQQEQNPPPYFDGAVARVELKARLRQLVSKVNAAVLPGPADLAALDGVIQRLCELSPTPDSATSDLINGRWVLLYTASSTTLPRAAAAAAVASPSSRLPGSPAGGGGGSGSSSAGGGGAYGGGYGSSGYGGGGGLDAALSPLQLANDVAYRFFYTYVPVLAGAAVGARGASSSGPVKPRGNFQVFDTRAGRVENQARFEVGGRLCCVNVNGTAQVVQGPVGRSRQRLRAVFTSFDLLVDGERRLSLPLSLLNPVGFVDTPYLDDEIRISVGDKGSVFIAARETAARDGDCSGGGGGGGGSR